MNLKIGVTGILMSGLCASVYIFSASVSGIDGFPKVVDIDTAENTMGIEAADRCSYVEVKEYGPHHVACYPSGKKFSPVHIQVDRVKHTHLRPGSTYENHLGTLYQSGRVAVDGQVYPVSALTFCAGDSCKPIRGL